MNRMAIRVAAAAEKFAAEIWSKAPGRRVSGGAGWPRFDALPGLPQFAALVVGPAERWAAVLGAATCGLVPARQGSPTGAPQRGQGTGGGDELFSRVAGHWR
ncbi:hypothetical protein SBA4_3990015 [Candidatus Sulfopaludibacter sp. SbA4]|nr:hypothetical protein SBA4_3990015 [Candidatus Sulfopaludibacter sp. SbA4]